MALLDELFRLTREQREGFLKCNSRKELEIQINRTREYLSEDAIEALVCGNWKRSRGAVMGESGGRSPLADSDNRASQQVSSGAVMGESGGRSPLADSDSRASQKVSSAAVEADILIGLFERYFSPSAEWQDLLRRARENESGLRRLYTKEEAVLAACRRIAGENEACKEALQRKKEPNVFCEWCLTMRGSVSEGKRRRLIREQARFVEYVTEGAPIPGSTEELLAFWERANRLEPRVYDDLPAHFRTDSDPVPFSRFLFLGRNGPVPEHKKTPPPEEIPYDLSLFLQWIKRQDLPPEMVAITTCFLLEYIHPFPDGNGHTARMLCCGLLRPEYEILTLTVFLEQFWAYRMWVMASIAEDKKTGGDMSGIGCFMMRLLIRGQERILENA